MFSIFNSSLSNKQSIPHFVSLNSIKNSQINRVFSVDLTVSLLTQPKRSKKNDYPQLISLWRSSVEATHLFLSQADIDKIEVVLPDY
jgi:hypothetical protein